MKKRLLLLVFLFLLVSFSKIAVANDVYLEYKLTGVSGKTIISKIYVKNREFRSETSMDFSGRQMVSTSLMLKSHPQIIITYNSMSKFYTEVKKPKNAVNSDFTIKVIGNEKVGKYNCTHVIMTSQNKSFDAWYTKELPSLSLPFGDNDALSNQKAIALLKSKGITGMVIKTAFLKPGSTTSYLTMELVKYEQKTLSTSLFTIPSGYKKSTANIDTEKMKNMTPAQQKEMIMKIMKEQRKH